MYKIEMLEKELSHPESMEYIGFLEQTGISYIGFLWRWIYLKKSAEDGEFELYSDIDSKIKNYSRIRSVVI